MLLFYVEGLGWLWWFAAFVDTIWHNNNDDNKTIYSFIYNTLATAVDFFFNIFFIVILINSNLLRKTKGVEYICLLLSTVVAMSCPTLLYLLSSNIGSVLWKTNITCHWISSPFFPLTLVLSYCVSSSLGREKRLTATVKRYHKTPCPYKVFQWNCHGLG